MDFHFSGAGEKRAPESRLRNGKGKHKGRAMTAMPSMRVSRPSQIMRQHGAVYKARPEQSVNPLRRFAVLLY